jgi:hypothetical protein
MKRTSQASNRTTLNLLVDIGTFVVFLVVCAPALTGLAIHEWLGLALMAPILTHLLLHWNWIVSISQRIFTTATSSARVNWALNILLFVAFTIATFSGLMISEVVLPQLGLPVPGDGVWLSLHLISANLSVLLIGLHVAFHWRWVVNATQRFLRRAAAGTVLAPRSSEPATSAVLEVR